LRKAHQWSIFLGMTPEIDNLKRRLRLSEGDILGLAREVAEDRRLPSVEQLSERQRGQLTEILQFLAEPARIEPALLVTRKVMHVADGRFRAA
jgi:hypothetical protein